MAFDTHAPMGREGEIGQEANLGKPHPHQRLLPTSNHDANSSVDDPFEDPIRHALLVAIHERLPTADESLPDEVLILGRRVGLLV
jgi:hypothetical protein